MGWASGSGLMCEIAEAMKKLGTAKKRIPVYKKIVAAFKAQDWDTQDEAVGVDCALDVVLLTERLDELEDYDDGEPNEVLDEELEDCRANLAKAKKEAGVRG